MTALRKVVDSSTLANIFDLPPALKNKKVEVVMFPAEETAEEISIPVNKNIPRLTMAQIEEAANAPEVQALVGVLEGAGLPEDISMKDIRQMRLAEKYQI
jgi:hypothetical protein